MGELSKPQIERQGCILDKNGKELSEGASVERIINGVRGGIVGKVLAATKLDVMVEWPGPNLCFYKPTLHSLLRRTYCCNELERVQPTSSTTEGAVNTGCPESERSIT